MKTNVSRPTPAKDDMRAQFDDGGASFQFNLGRMWRAAGCPVDKTPAEWAALAQPVIDGYGAYFAALQRRRPDGVGRLEDQLVTHSITEADAADFVADGFPGEWRPGDMMAIYFLALTYAAFVDAPEGP